MKRLSDVNTLVALVAERALQHATVRSWVKSLPDDEPICICRSVQTGFLRLLCTEAVMGAETLRLSEAWGVYAHLLDSGRFAFAFEPPRLDVTWAGLCMPFDKSPKVVMDAYLAGFAIAGGYRLIGMDRAFRQFQGLEWEYPSLSRGPR
jgi:toxin-antitoxin system PIN domain toxin